MPQPPIVLPIIITGLTLGSILASQAKTISKKKFAAIALLSGLLNSAYAFLLYTLSPPPTFSRAGFTGSTGYTGAQFRVQTGSETSFIISSFITGLIFFIAVCGIALVYARFRGKKDHEEDEVEDEKEDSDDDLGKLEDT
jgi:Trk-type K+ transport system membrane component